MCRLKHRLDVNDIADFWEPHAWAASVHNMLLLGRGMMRRTSLPCLVSLDVLRIQLQPLRLPREEIRAVCLEEMASAFLQRLSHD